MLKLQANEVIYNNSINLGDVYSLSYSGAGFSIALPDNSMMFIPEEDCTQSEAEVFTAWKEAHKNDPEPEPQKPVTVNETIDEEKVAMGGYYRF